MSSLICRSEFTGTKSLERSSNKLSRSFGLLPCRENRGGLCLSELRRELPSVSESRRECLSRIIASLGWELDLRGVEVCSSGRKWRRNSKTLELMEVWYSWDLENAAARRGGGVGNVLLRIGSSSTDEVGQKELEWAVLGKLGLV